MLTIKEYLKLGNNNLDEQYDDEDDLDYSLSNHDRNLYKKYRKHYLDLIDNVDQINAIAERVGEDALNDNDNAVNLGKHCAQLIGDMGRLAQKFDDEQLGEFLFEILCVADDLYTRYPHPSNFADGGEFYTTSIENLDNTVEQYQQTGDFDAFEA